MRKLFILFLLPTISSFGQSNQSKEIYELLNFVIKDRGLNRTHGLDIIPEDQFQNTMRDNDFLNELIVQNKVTDSLEEKELTIIEGDTLITLVSVTFPLKPKCLTADDVKYMLTQKESNKDFRWDNSKLKFNLDNHDNWFTFSVPIFSVDKTIALIMVRHLCKGLCGTGSTLLLKKENGTWTTTALHNWIH